eukprot:UN28546
MVRVQKNEEVKKDEREAFKWITETMLLKEDPTKHRTTWPGYQTTIRNPALNTPKLNVPEETLSDTWVFNDELFDSHTDLEQVETHGKQLLKLT